MVVRHGEPQSRRRVLVVLARRWGRGHQGLDEQLGLEHVARANQEVAPQVGVGGGVADGEVDVGGLEVQAQGPLPWDKARSVGEGVVAVVELWMCLVVRFVFKGVPAGEVVREIVVNEHEGDGPDEDEGDEDDTHDLAPQVSASRLDLLLGPNYVRLW